MEEEATWLFSQTTWVPESGQGRIKAHDILPVWGGMRLVSKSCGSLIHVLTLRSSLVFTNESQVGTENFRTSTYFGLRRATQEMQVPCIPSVVRNNPYWCVPKCGSEVDFRACQLSIGGSLKLSHCENEHLRRPPSLIAQVDVLHVCLATVHAQVRLPRKIQQLANRNDPTAYI